MTSLLKILYINSQDYFSSFLVTKDRLFKSYFCKLSKTFTIRSYVTFLSILTMILFFLSVIFDSSLSKSSNVISFP